MTVLVDSYQIVCLVSEALLTIAKASGLHTNDIRRRQCSILEWKVFCATGRCIVDSLHDHLPQLFLKIDKSLGIAER
jgi:hypothetical protein